MVRVKPLFLLPFFFLAMGLLVESCALEPNNIARLSSLEAGSPSPTPSPSPSVSPSPSPSPSPTPTATFYLIGGITGTGTSTDRVIAASPADLTLWQTTARLGVELSYPAAAVRNNQLVIAGGVDIFPVFTAERDGFISNDGVNFQHNVAALPDSRYGASLALFQNTLFLIGGANTFGATSTIATSTNNTGWSAGGNLPAARLNGVALVFNSRIYYLGGQSGASVATAVNTIYGSPDGTLWTSLGSTLPLKLSGLSAFVFNNKVWIIGGQNDSAPSGYQSAVYSSSDLTTWTKVGDIPAPRSFMTALTYNGTMYLLGGRDTNGNATATIWSSTDGATWTSAGTLSQPLYTSAGVVSTVSGGF